ncbi:hypothetical protein [Pseudomonas aeruginosa]|uniref:hypothetical protein n=1 Tax=Pseudomonas aeruginosa TaxID=287 RepID=UPI003EE1765F
MSEVKRYINCVIGMTGVEMVRATDYAKLDAEAQALREEVAKLRTKLAMAEDAAAKGDAARQQCGGMEMEIEELRAELAELRARVVVVPDVTGYWDGLYPAQLRAPHGGPVGFYTIPMVRTDELARLNGKVVSEGLLRDLLKSAQKLSDRASNFMVSGVEFIEIGDNNSAIVELEVTLDELRDLLGKGKEDGHA